MPSSLHHLLNVHVQIANKMGNYKKKKKKNIIRIADVRRSVAREPLAVLG
jgi:hypothetical protein